MATASAPTRERTKVSVRAPSVTRSAITRAASAPAERRTAAPFSPVTPAPSSGGSQSATVRDPCGDPSEVTATHGAPMSFSAVAAGSAVVAEHSTNTGSAPYRCASRRSRRSTSATCDPKTPR